MKYQIILQLKAQQMLSEIIDRRIQEQIRNRIDALVFDPDKQGKPLSGELVGYRSIRAVGQRYWIIYRVEQNKVVVFVVALGIRREGDKKDIYELARRLIRYRLLEPAEEYRKSGIKRRRKVKV